jgi:hypothetical protein
MTASTRINDSLHCDSVLESEETQKGRPQDSGESSKPHGHAHGAARAVVGGKMRRAIERRNARRTEPAFASGDLDYRVEKPVEK